MVSKDYIRVIVISIFIFIISVIWLLSGLFHNPKKDLAKNIENCNALVKYGKTTMALYDSTYTKFGNRDGILIGYKYVVNNVIYKFNISMDGAPKEDTFELTYLPSNPNIHSTDPKGELKNYKNQLDDDSLIYIPWVLFAFSLSAGYLSFRKLRNMIAQEKEIAGLARLNPSKIKV
jgi:hypothetical protein